MRYTDKSSFLCGAHEDIVYPRNIKLENIALVTTVEGIKLFAFLGNKIYQVQSICDSLLSEGAKAPVGICIPKLVT